MAFSAQLACTQLQSPLGRLYRIAHPECLRCEKANVGVRVVAQLLEARTDDLRDGCLIDDRLLDELLKLPRDAELDVRNPVFGTLDDSWKHRVMYHVAADDRRQQRNRHKHRHAIQVMPVLGHFKNLSGAHKRAVHSQL